MSLDIFLQTLINGLFLGGVYAAFTIGLTLIYGVMKLINFAHGEFLMLGMYIAYWAFTWFGIDPYVSAFIALLIMFLVGLFIQYSAYRHVLKAPLLNQVLLSLGVSTLLIGLAQFFFGALPRSIILPYSSKAILIGNLVLNVPRLIGFVVALVLCILLYFFLMKTKIGKAIRACSQNGVASQLMGIDVDRINMLTFALGAALVGVAGAMLTPTFPMSPTVGQNFSISGFVIVVLGSMGNFIGAFLASMIIGIAETFGGFIIGSQMKYVVSLTIFILILLFRPQGLFGRKSS